ncbi:hypothetical protein D4R86_00345 [bacterium]|nr:MAG: hypothetical protein D4R86_00345 [bacterium]
MKLYKISQNIDYLNKIGVPSESQQEILDYLMSLDGDTRKTVLRKIRKNPAVDLAQVKELETDTKKDYLRGQGYPEEVVDFAVELSSKYAVWIAREIKNYYDPEKINEGLKQRTLGERMVGFFGTSWQAYMSGILDWIKQNDPDIMEMSMDEALEEATIWHAELKEAESDVSNYKTHNTVFKLPDGWEIVKLDSGDCETEGDLMGHCFAEGTLVRTKDGYKPIEKITTEDKVLCEDGTFRKIISTFNRDYEGDIIKLNTRFGVEDIIVTPEHQFMCLIPEHLSKNPCRLHTCGRLKSNPENNHKIGWKEISSIGKDGYLLSTTLCEYTDIDYISIPYEFILRKTKGTEKFEVNEDFLWIIGMYMAEGSSDGDKIQFALSSQETEYANRIISFFKSHGLNPYIRKEKEEYNGLVVKIPCRKLAKWLPSWVGQYCYNKIIPPELLNLPNHKIKHLLRGILDGDGCESCNVLHQTSKILALQVAEIGLRIGTHKPTISVKDNTDRNRKMSFIVDHADPNIPRNRPSRKRGIWEHKGQVLIKPYKFKTENFSGKVYNIEVDTVKSYVVQNLLVHNCVKGYADDVAQGRTEIYSLRDPKNNPHATIEMNTYQRFMSDEVKKPKYGVEIRQIQGKGNEDPIPEYKAMIKIWFNGLKQQGYEFDAIDESYQYGADNTKVKDLGEALGKEDDYGVPMALGGIGGDKETYYENLEEAYQEGYAGSRWYEGTSKEIINNLVTYAELNKELDKIEQARDKFSDWAWRAWIDAEHYIKFENPRPYEDEDYPNKGDFMVQPDIKEQQPESANMPFQQVFNEQAYNEALKEYQAKEQAYEEELEGHEKYFEPYIFSNYLYEEIEEAKQRKIAKENGSITQQEPVEASIMKTRIYKMADVTNTVKDEDIPQPDVLATYIEAIKTYLNDATNIPKIISEQIENLPSPSQVKKNYSFEECKILFETVNYLWKKITKTDIVQDPIIENSPETLFGNYWMLKNGVLLRGNNHTSIIKQNSSLFCSLLNLNAFTLLQYLSSDPNKLIGYVLRNGGVRIFINKDKKAYFQMSEQIYAKWGRKKVRELDFDKKNVKILDFNQDYNGWDSGIAIRL